jgi:hypothetical protein
MIRTNREQLVELSVIGEISSPTMKSPYRVHPDGTLHVLPSVGGITYNMRIGDPAVGIAADHVEPGVSIKNPHGPSGTALNVLACIGNEAIVVSGEGKGMAGRVTGKHGGVDHVMIDFEPEQLQRLTIGDRIQIRAVGTGMQLLDFPEITVMNLSPWLLDRLPWQAVGGKLTVPVTHQIPPQLLGAGLGEDNAYLGDVDIQLFDGETVAEYGLASLRFGDFVAMLDSDHRYGRIYKRGMVSIGVITHSCSTNAGHGPGVTTILTGPASILTPQIVKASNLAEYFR